MRPTVRDIGSDLLDVAVTLRRNSPLVVYTLEGLLTANPAPPYLMAVASFLLRRLVPARVRVWSFGDDGFVAVIQTSWCRRVLWRVLLVLARVQFRVDGDRLVLYDGLLPETLPEILPQSADVVVRRTLQGSYVEARLRQLSSEEPTVATITIDGAFEQEEDTVRVWTDIRKELVALEDIGVFVSIRDEVSGVALSMVVELRAPGGWSGVARALV